MPASKIATATGAAAPLSMTAAPALADPRVSLPVYLIAKANTAEQLRQLSAAMSSSASAQMTTTIVQTLTYHRVTLITIAMVSAAAMRC
jgi:hypothetical protein